jgi:pyruvate dehydrogenase E2 component (dihydrolipoamide acetyltransferase)
VRKQARELGVQLTAVKGTGRNGRILKEDVKGYVKKRIESGSGDASAGIPPIPEVDFSRFGEVEHRPLPRIRQISARNLHRSWLNVPHVTQFDEADVTDLEDFRRAQNAELARDADAAGIKLTPLAFIIRACVGALQEFPQFNSSIAPDFSELIIKRYINVGIAVETDEGLMVPVLKAADTKGVIDLARDSSELAQKARDKKLPMDAIQGATFTISSLGGIGGTAFTPIVNAPEVAILGVSRSRVLPQYDGAAFVPRTMLPLSLSYDHRAIDGAEAARFTAYLATLLADVRRLIL